MTSPLEPMGISEQQAIAAVGFLTTYANTVVGELEEMTAATPGLPSWWDDDERFGPAADAAGALREATQWLMYLSPQAAVDRMRQAGRLFLRLREPFGLYLLAVSGFAAEPALAGVAYGTLGAVLDADDPDRQAESPLHWQHPQRQAYLVLAATAMTSVSDVIGPMLSEVLAASPHRESGATVGALGTPIHRLWDIAEWLAGSRGSNQWTDPADAIAEHLSAMSTRYAETMRTAQSNTYLWHRGLSPVDVGDIDIAGIACLTARRFGPGALEEAAESLGAIAGAPIRAGLELARATGQAPAAPF